MRRYTAGLLLANVALAASLAMPTFFLWDAEHIGNPLWHPHARFHAVQLWLLMMVAALTALITLWRAHRTVASGRRPDVPTLSVVMAVPLAFWAGEFVAWAVPGTDVRPDLENPNTFPLLGFDVYGNAFGAVIVIALFVSGWGLLVAGIARRGADTDAPADERTPDPARL